MRRELTISQLFVSCVLYAALTALLAYPFSLHVAGATLSRGTDADLWVWTLGWDVHAFTHRPWAIFDANIFFPFRNTLAYSENLIGSAFFAAPVIWLGGSAALAMNLLELGSIAVSALGANLLGRRLGLSAPAAILCGLVYGFAPPRFLRIDQLHLTTIQWVPFAMAYLHAYFGEGRARDLRMALGFLSLQALTSGHGAAFLTFGMALLAAWHLALGKPLAVEQTHKRKPPRTPSTQRISSNSRRTRRPRRLAFLINADRQVKNAIARGARDAGIAGVLLLLPAVLIYLPYRAAQAEVGLRRQLEDVQLSWSSFFASGSHVQTWLLAHAPRWPWLTGEPDAWLFPGWLPLVLAAIACVRRRGDAADTHTSGVDEVSASDRWFYVVLGLVCLWLALGPSFGLWRLVYWWPGFSFVRVPSRFVLLGVLALGVLAGAGFDRITACVSRRSSSRRSRDGASTVASTAEAAQLAEKNIGNSWRSLRALRFTSDFERMMPGRGWWACAIGAAMVVEFAAGPLTAEPATIPQPAIERWLAAQPRTFALLELPIPDSRSAVTRERRDTLFMLHSMAHWQPIWEGYSGIQPPGFMDSWWLFTRFPDEESLATARRLGITHVILHTDLVPPEERGDVDTRFARWAGDVVLEHVEGEGRLYAIRVR